MPAKKSTRQPLYQLGRIARGREADGWMVEIVKLDPERVDKRVDTTIVVHVASDGREAAANQAERIADALNAAIERPWPPPPEVALVLVHDPSADDSYLPARRVRGELWKRPASWDAALLGEDWAEVVDDGELHWRPMPEAGT